MFFSLFLNPASDAAGQVASYQKSRVSDAIRPQQLKQRIIEEV